MNLENLRHGTQEEFDGFCKALASQFDFLIQYGFIKDKEYWPRTNSSKDGFHVHFQKPGFGISVEYFDMEFDLRFEVDGERISFYFIDRELFQNKSGLQGSMFPREKLPQAIDVVAKEMKGEFRSILENDSGTWEALFKKYRAPVIKKKRLPG